MDILKRIGCRILAPLLLSITGLLMIVVVPMNASQFLAEEEDEVQNSGIESDSAYYQPNGLIYLHVKKDVEQITSDTGAAGVYFPDKKNTR